MNSTRAILAVITLLFTLSMLGLTIWLATFPYWGGVVVAAMITLGFSVFCYHDYLFFFGKKKDEVSK